MNVIEQIEKYFGDATLYVSRKSNGKYVAATIQHDKTVTVSLTTLHKLDRYVMLWYPTSGVHRLVHASHVG